MQPFDYAQGKPPFRVPRVGLEPTTNGLRGHCSTIELAGLSVLYYSEKYSRRQDLRAGYWILRFVNQIEQCFLEYIISHRAIALRDKKSARSIEKF